MLFNSWEFLVLLCITFVVFYGLPNNGFRRCGQTIVLLIASTVFYGWQDYRLLAILAISCGGNAVASIQILQHKLGGREQAAKRWVAGAVILNLLLLATFKYAGFVAATVLNLFPSPAPEACVAVANWFQSIPLPIGISFYTFHGISMVVDMSRGKVHAYDQAIRREPLSTVYTRMFRDMGLYLLFFPQLIAGPIIKAHFFWPQIRSKFFAQIAWDRAFRYLVTGYFFKMVVADNLAPVTEVLRSDAFISTCDGVKLLILLFGYSIQIFADFGGYSMIAIGLAALFGYRFPINFNFPYISTSLTQFWQRWNMTLSAWLRDYLYIPLGGNRKGHCRTYLNLFLVMFLGGLWHGADWKFALWGTLHGVFLALERFVGNTRWGSRLRMPQWISIPYCFSVVTCLWATFLMPDIETVGHFFRQVVCRFSTPLASLATDAGVYSVLFFSLFVVVYHLWGWWRENECGQRVPFRGRLSLRGSLVYGFMIFMILTNSGPQCGFVYFQF